MIAARIASEQGIVARALAAEHQACPLDELGPYGALLRSYRFLLTREAADFAPAVEALRRAVSQDPGFGLAWTQLGRLYAANYAVELVPDGHADRGGREPRGEGRSPRAHEPPEPSGPGHGPALRGGDRGGSGRGGARAQPLPGLTRVPRRARLDPDPPGRWERGRGLVDRAISATRTTFRSSSRPGGSTTSASASWTRPTARRSGTRTPCTSGGRSCSRPPWGCQGRLAEAERDAAELVRRRPDFPSRGRILIGRFIKFPEVSEPIVAGLERAGLCLEYRQEQLSAKADSRATFGAPPRDAANAIRGGRPRSSSRPP